MNILYGVCGEGFGHSSRAKEIASYLQRKGHKVKILTYGQALGSLSNDFDTQKVYGAHILFEGNELDFSKTIRYNLINLSRNIPKIKKIASLVKNFKPDLCISDMDPVVPIISYFYRLPLISIDNQHIMAAEDIKVPKNHKRDYIIAKAVTRQCVRKADAFIVLSFFRPKETKKNVYIVNPIIRKDVLKLKPKYGRKILVYLTKKNAGIMELLKGYNKEFIVYGFDVNKTSGNLKFKRFGTGFLKDLSECGAVIATAGFSLISEALYLKKPYLAVPLHGQFEQFFNSIMLKKSGCGDYSEKLSRKDLDLFFARLGRYRNNLKNYKTDSSEVFSVLRNLLGKYI